MKTLWISTIILLCSLTLSAQDAKQYGGERHELNIGFFNVIPFTGTGQVYPYMYDAIWYPYYYENPMIPIGLQYKFHFLDFAVRAGVGINYRTEENKQSPSYQYEREQLVLNYKVGLQYNYQWNRVRLFAGVDLFQREKTNNESSYYQWTNADQSIQFSSSKYENSQRERGLSPFLGTQFFVTENISIGLETSVDFARYRNSSEYNLEPASISKGFSIKSGNLSQISVNVHF
jgi:hypothetical protein